MRKVLKWFLRGLLVVGILVLGAAAIGYAFISRTLPTDDGAVRLADLEQSVSVVRDKEAVPHIIGKSLIDVAAAQGYVHAQERLWQMETFRMAGQGRLSEMFGDKTVDTDKFLRTLNLAGHSKASFEHLNDKTKAILVAYAGGVNAFIERERRMFEPSLSVEFMILGHTPEPWQPWQSMMTIKIMALTLGSNMSSEIKRLALASKGFAPEDIDQLVGYHAKDNPPPLPDLRKLYGFPPSGKVASKSAKQEYTALADSGTGFDLEWPIGVTASNNWVLAGSRTKSGKVLLANDPHLGLTAPSIWYLAHLSWQEDGQTKNLIGASMPSIPLVMLGRNDKVGWGFTTSVLDSQDLFIERINPENKNQYQTENGWADFGIRNEVIKVSGKPDVAFTIRTTRHGPVLPETYKNLDRYLPDQHVAALKWIAMTDDDTSMNALLGMVHSKNVSEFINNTRPLVSPMQSIVVGDVDGNIGFIAPSRVAIRSSENDIMGRAPVPGWESKYDWQGFLNFDQLPQKQNPSSGILFSANSKFVDQDYAPHLTFDWAEDFRHNRIDELLVKSNTPKDVEAMKTVQADTYSPALIEFRDVALSLLPDGLSTDKNIVDAIKKWDGRMTRDGAVPLIMMAWFKSTSEALLMDDLGEDYELFGKGRISILLGILKTGTSRDWCDNRKSPGVQTCGQIVQQSLIAALKSLRSEYGDDWNAWRWGRAHIAYGEHRPFANVPPLDKLFNVEIESAGGPYSLLRGQNDFNKDKPYVNHHGSSYRAIYDFSDLNQSLYIHTTGQSGNFLSPHYSDMASRWADVNYIRMTTNPADFEKDAIGVWKFSK